MSRLSGRAGEYRFRWYRCGWSERSNYVVEWQAGTIWRARLRIAKGEHVDNSVEVYVTGMNARGINTLRNNFCWGKSKWRNSFERKQKKRRSQEPFRTEDVLWWRSLQSNCLSRNEMIIRGKHDEKGTLTISTPIPGSGFLPIPVTTWLPDRLLEILISHNHTDRLVWRYGYPSVSNGFLYFEVQI